MNYSIENTRINSLLPLLSPEELKRLYPRNKIATDTITLGRRAVKTSLKSSKATKLVAVVGPCSIHDPIAAIEYATWLRSISDKYSEKLSIFMRVYFEKPRTTVGWKGLINDPHLDGSYDINFGLKLARKLLLEINNIGIPTGTELLDTLTPQYFSDLVSWGAIGARTTESQLHRELVSGISFPVGFKNSTSGNVQVAIDAMQAASASHHFPAITEEGKVAIASTAGNPDTHVILRGGTGMTNYDSTHIQDTRELLQKVNFLPRMMIDLSHANSQKDHTKQKYVAQNIAQQLQDGEASIFGVMIESNLIEGNQAFKPGKKLEYGKSITDACVGLKETEAILDLLYKAV
jgi:3-deoxy-7-phosphoheptulonate synthase